MGLKLASNSFKDRRSVGTKKHATKLTGAQYRLGKTGNALDQAYSDVDAGFKAIEAEEADCTTANANKVVAGSATIESGNTSVTLAGGTGVGQSGIGAGQNSAKPRLCFRTDDGAAEAQDTRYTMLVQGNGEVTITSRDAAGNAVDPGLDVTISYLFDQR
tara:strand:- start:344 stop:823 length:480 start_codon:yes stop_codon:yes gene_type:complete